MTNNTPCVLFILGKHLYCVLFPRGEIQKAAGEIYIFFSPAAAAAALIIIIIK